MIDCSLKLIKFCNYCGKDFKGSIKNRFYCSEDCFLNSQKDRKRKYSRDNKERIKETKTTCKYCKGKFKKKELKRGCCNNKDCKEEQNKMELIKNNTKKDIKNKKTKDYDKINKRISGTKKEMREWVDSLKKKEKCKFCGEERWYCLVYHHINPNDKKFGIANAISQSYSKNAILDEIKKCIVLCSNCHIELHYKEKQEKDEIENSIIKEEVENNKKEMNKIIEDREKEEKFVNDLYYKKILYYKVVEEELQKEWLIDIKEKAENNLNLFRGCKSKDCNFDKNNKINISKIIANSVGISAASVSKAIQIYKRGTEDQKQRARLGIDSLEKIYNELKK